MQNKEFNVLLDIKESNSTTYIEVVQGDYGTNTFIINLTDNFNPINLTNLNVEVVFRKVDGKTVVQDTNTGVSIEDAVNGKIKCTLLTNTIACPGRVTAEVRILEGNNVLTSTRFNFFVRASLTNDETIKSTNEFPILKKLTDDAKEANEEFPKIKEFFNAVRNEEETRVNQENTRTSNENSRQTSENQRVDNETSRNENEKGRITAENVRKDSENIRKSNEDIRDKSEQNRVNIFNTNENSRKNEFNEIKNEYSTLKKVMIDENNVANLQNQINNVNSQLTENATKSITDTANIISLPNAVDGIMNFELQGNTLQNLLGSQGTSERTLSTDLTLDVLINPNTVYTISIDIDKATATITDLSANLGGTVGTISSVVAGYKRYRVKVTTPTTLSASTLTLSGLNMKVKSISVMEGDYVNSSLSYFEGIKSVGEAEDNKIEVLSCGKNLVNVNTDTLNDYFVDISGVYRYAAGTKSIIIKVTQGKQYTLSKNGGDRVFYGFFSKLPTTQGEQSLSYGESLTTSIAPAGAKYLVWYVSNVGTAFPTNIQVEEGAVTTPYEPYKVDKIDILTTAPLRGLPNGARDSIGSDGVLTRKVGKVVLNGSENWVLDNTFTNIIEFANAHSASTHQSKLVCDKIINCKYVPGDDFEYISKGDNFINIKILKSKLTTQDVAGFKAWLQTNPVTVYYELAEPVVEDTKQPLSLKCFKGGSLQTNTAIPPVAIVRYPSTVSGRISTVEEAMANMTDSLGGAWKTLLSLADRELRMKSITTLTTETNADLKAKINEMIGVWK